MTNWLGSQLQIDDLVHLMSLDEQFNPNVAPLKQAEKLTIEICGVMVLERRDRTIFRSPINTNDVFISSAFRYRNGEPEVSKMHFFQNRVPVGEWLHSLDNNVIISVLDFNNSDIQIKIRIYDIDEHFDPAFFESLSRVPMAALAFPSLAPYAAVGSLAASLAPEIVRLIDQLDHHDKIIDERIRLEIRSPKEATPILQPGYIVCFSHDLKPEVASNLWLCSDLHVFKNKNKEEPFKDCSYAVLRIDRNTIEKYQEMEITQKAAKLMAELNGKGSGAKASLDFLLDTVGIYTRYKKLERLTELQKKDPKSLAKEETELKNNLTEDLQKDEIFKLYLK